MIHRRQLIVNADDFGFTPDVNQGIVEAHAHGILTSATLMANGDAFEDAVRLARQTPQLDVGCHLVLIGGRSLLTGKALPATGAQFLWALASRQLPVYEELRAQVRRIVDSGLQPTHLDTHKHTHLAPPVLEAVASLAQEFGILWIRQPFDFPLRHSSRAVPYGRQVTSASLAVLQHRFQRVLERHHCRATDHFAGFQMTGTFGTRELVGLLRIIPAGITELMCHPGRCGPELRRAATRLKESREEELKALTAPEVRRVIDQEGIELVSYRRL